MNQYKYILIGALNGFTIALLFLTLGFFKTILLLLFTVVGSIVGWYVKKVSIMDYFK